MIIAFVSNYWKVFLGLKLSYFTKIFGRGPHPKNYGKYLLIMHWNIYILKGNWLVLSFLLLRAQRKDSLSINNTFQPVLSRKFRLYSSPGIFVILMFYRRNGGRKGSNYFESPRNGCNFL